MLAKTNGWDAVISFTALSFFTLLVIEGNFDLAFCIGAFAAFTIGICFLGMYKKDTLGYSWTIIDGVILFTFLLHLGGIYTLSAMVGFSIYAIIYYISLMRPKLCKVSYEIGFGRLEILYVFVILGFALYYVPAFTDDVMKGTLFVVLVGAFDLVVSQFIDKVFENK